MSNQDDADWLRTEPKQPPVVGRVTVVDLFAGCGGLSLGLDSAASRVGIEIGGLAVEADEDIASVYAANFPTADVRACSVEELVDGDSGDALTEAEQALADQYGDAAILMGGPPCQGHSDLNNHTRRDDPRNRLYLRMARAAEVLDPAVVVIENVPSVVHDATDVVGETVKILEKCGYAIDHRVVRLVDVGVPQTRRRHLLMASRVESLNPSAVLDEIVATVDQPRTVEWAIKDLVGANDGPMDVHARRSAENIKRMEYLFAEDEYNLPNDKRPPCHRDKEHTYNAVYGRLRWDKPAPTITSGFTSMGQGRYVHPSEMRTLTPHEAARIQSFPDWFRWETSRRTLLSTMIGNAVPPFLMGQLASRVFPFIEVAPPVDAS